MVEVILTNGYADEIGDIELECPLCFGRLYCFSAVDIVCENNIEHHFSMD